jgi:hypothetical protein
MTDRATSAQKIAVGMLVAGGVLVIAIEAAVVWQFSQMVPYTNAPPPDSPLYWRTFYLGGALVVGAFAILLYEGWRTLGLAGMWNIIRPKTRMQKFGCGVWLVGFIMAALNNIGGNLSYSIYGLIVMMVGSILWPAIKKDPANS